MNPETYEGRLELMVAARDASREAAKILIEGFRSRPEVTRKGRVDLVTEYDRASERFLRERLLRVTAIAVVGEEEGGARSSGPGGATWFVDPLDGTTNFVHGHPYFCVSVGLVVERSPVVGVVIAPMLNLEYLGVVEGEPVQDAIAQATPGARRMATRNGEPCAVSDVSVVLDALLATGFPYDVHTSSDNNLDAFVMMMRRCQAIRRCGSAALDLCHVADGTYDGYWERKLKPWDLAAGAAIVLAAGGTLSAFDGGPPDVAVGHLVATNGVLHATLLEELARR
jgi:myo-inositol-1(or 4)-monophosphatase